MNSELTNYSRKITGPTTLLTCAAIFLSTQAGCSSNRPCDAPTVEFTFTDNVSESTLQTFFSRTGDTRESIECASFCEYLSGRSFESFDSCMLEIEPASGQAPGDIVGLLECEGQAYEYLCE